jgi:hypothetical protein
VITARFSVEGETVPQLWSQALEIAAKLYDCDQQRFDPRVDNFIPLSLHVTPLVRVRDGTVTLWTAEARCGS